MLSYGRNNTETVGYIYNLCVLTKGLTLNNQNKIKNRIIQSNDTSLRMLYMAWKENKSTYSKIANKNTAQNVLDSLLVVINEQEKLLSSKSTVFRENNIQNINYQDIQNKLKKDQACIEIIRLEYEQNDTTQIAYAGLILTKNNSCPTLVLLSDSNELESKYITNYRRSIQSKMPDELSYNAF